jgi:hypothetical protein
MLGQRHVWSSPSFRPAWVQFISSYWRSMQMNTHPLPLHHSPVGPSASSANSSTGQKPCTALYVLNRLWGPRNFLSNGIRSTLWGTNQRDSANKPFTTRLTLGVNKRRSYGSMILRPSFLSPTPSLAMYCICVRVHASVCVIPVMVFDKFSEEHTYIS